MHIVDGNIESRLGIEQAGTQFGFKGGFHSAVQSTPATSGVALALLLAIMTAGSGILGGCSGTKSGQEIAAIARDASGEASTAEHAGLVEAAAPKRIKIYWNGPWGGDNSGQQIVLMQKVIERKVIGIVVTPNTPFAVNTEIERALSSNIPVVVLGDSVPVQPDRALTFVLNDNQAAATLAADRIRTRVHESAAIAVIGADPDIPGTIELSQAFQARMADFHGQVLILAGQEAPAAMLRDALNSRDDIRAIYALTPQSTRGARDVLQALGKAGQVLIVGSDQTNALTVLLREAEIDSLIIRDTRMMGAAAVNNIVALRSHQAVEQTRFFQPRLLTRDNIDTKLMQNMLRMDWRVPQ